MLKYFRVIIRTVEIIKNIIRVYIDCENHSHTIPSVFNRITKKKSKCIFNN